MTYSKYSTNWINPFVKNRSIEVGTHFGFWWFWIRIRWLCGAVTFNFEFMEVYRYSWFVFPNASQRTFQAHAFRFAIVNSVAILGLIAIKLFVWSIRRCLNLLIFDSSSFTHVFLEPLISSGASMFSSNHIHSPASTSVFTFDINQPCSGKWIRILANELGIDDNSANVGIRWRLGWIVWPLWRLSVDRINWGVCRIWRSCPVLRLQRTAQPEQCKTGS